MTVRGSNTVLLTQRTDSRGETKLVATVGFDLFRLQRILLLDFESV